MFRHRLHTVDQLVSIDLRLRFALFGLELVLDRAMYPAEVERVFVDARGDRTSPKEYLFHASRRCRVTGRVDEYEPETIVLRVEASRGLCDRAAAAFGSAEEWATRTERDAT